VKLREPARPAALPAVGNRPRKSKAFHPSTIFPSTTLTVQIPQNSTALPVAAPPPAVPA